MKTEIIVKGQYAKKIRGIFFTASLNYRYYNYRRCLDSRLLRSIPFRDIRDHKRDTKFSGAFKSGGAGGLYLLCRVFVVGALQIQACPGYAQPACGYFEGEPAERTISAGISLLPPECALLKEAAGIVHSDAVRRAVSFTFTGDRELTVSAKKRI